MFHLKLTRHLFALIISISIASPLFANALKHAIIVDAGSSGSRLHVYEYSASQARVSVREIATFSQKPGISSYATNPEQAGPAIQPLFNNANSKLEELKIDPKSVNVSVLGTGGMRLLDETTQKAIYQSIQNTLKTKTPFPVKTIETISGQMEGIYSWISVNYLLENFQKAMPTVGAIDMGGASTQITFTPNNSQKDESTKTVRILDNSYRVFSLSILGAGQDQARIGMQREQNAKSCFPNNYVFNKDGAKGQFHAAACRDSYANWLRGLRIRDQIPSISSNQGFVAFSGIYYAMRFFNQTGPVKQASIQKAITTECSRTWEELQQKYPKEDVNYLSTYCANASYHSELLFNTYQIQDDGLTVAQKINSQDIDWALGSLIYSMFN